MKSTTNRTTMTLSVLAAILLFGATVIPAIAQEGESLSIDVKPGPLEATPFTFPDFSEFTTENDLHVYVVENHAVPAVTFSLVFHGGDAYDEPGKDGAISIMGDMLSKGTKNRSALQIAQALDGVGAGISTSVTGQSITISGSALKKHLPLLVTILGEMLTEPTFNQDEIEKLRTQYLASVANRRGDAMETAQSLARKVVYGFNNPLGRRATEESLKSINRDDVVNSFKKFIIPNNASLAFVGDITQSEVESIIRENFANWTKKDQPELTLQAMETAPAGVYFVPREGSVQTSLVVSAAAPGFNDEDWLALNVASSYFGSSFGSVLFSTLRETYSYTYSPFGYLTRGSDYNRVATGAEVRSSVTDSALTVILKELKELSTNGPAEKPLNNRIALLAGQYALAMERPSTVANLLQNGWMRGSSNESVANYAERLKKVSWGDVKSVSEKYLNANNLRIMAVGAPEVREKLKAFGTVYDYDVDLNPASGDTYADADMDADDVREAYIEALGGEDAVEGVKSIAYTGKVKMSMQGQSMDGEAERKVMAPNMEYTSMKLPVMQQTQWFNGNEGWVSLNGGAPGAMKPDEVAEQKESAGLFPGLGVGNEGWKSEVLGAKGGEVHVSVVNGTGKKSLYVFSQETMLLDRIEKTEQTPNGPMLNTTLFKDYSDVGGVKVPSTLQIKNAMYTIDFSWTVAVNSGVAESDFSPAK